MSHAGRRTRALTHTLPSFQLALLARTGNKIRRRHGAQTVKPNELARRGNKTVALLIHGTNGRANRTNNLSNSVYYRQWALLHFEIVTMTIERVKSIPNAPLMSE